MLTCVIEGPDNSGKTTLAKALEARGFVYHHYGPPAEAEDVFETYTDALLKAQRSFRHHVFDRLHVAELVYGPVARGRSKLTLAQLRLLNRLLFAEGGCVVFCLAPEADLLASWEQRKDQEYLSGVDQVRAVIGAYKKLYFEEFLGLNTLGYDRTVPEWKGQPDQFILRLLSALLSSCWKERRRCPAGVIGSPVARYLVVGERPGGARDLAFYADTNSSRFLNQALWDAGYREDELAFTNAYAKDGGARDLRAIHEKLRRPTALALGRAAQAACDAAGVPHLRVPHPQYAKRFLSKQQARYVELLCGFREKKKGGNLRWQKEKLQIASIAERRSSLSLLRFNNTTKQGALTLRNIATGTRKK